jgi:beta-glucanase (GH16 family)
MPLLLSDKEPDDYLHNPDPRRDRINDRGGSIFTARGTANLGCLSLLIIGCLGLFAGYPLAVHFTAKTPSTQGGFNVGGINASGQVPSLPGNFGLIDKDTPADAYTYKSYHDNSELVLVFSDEFEADGRTFYPGDDPFWEGVDLHYWGTNNLEWYDPVQATTKGGNLQLRMELRTDPENNHNMKYRSAMIQTWNKFCFTGGLIMARVMLPGSPIISGLWPAIWTMGNLGRAGFGASVEGLWPYAYDSCDVGTLPNQTYPGEQRPAAALVNGDGLYGGVLSYLPGQRLSACTCRGESHPGPMRTDGTYVGRSAPEIDVLEATIIQKVPWVSMSSQFAPFNAAYYLDQTQAEIYNSTSTQFNSYRGGAFQQTASAVGLTNTSCYETTGRCYAIYGFEYVPGFDSAYITWINQVKAWTVFSSAFKADPVTEVSARPVPQEPMYIIANLGMAQQFGTIDADIDSVFPATMEVDWIRVYQQKDKVNVGCDPKDFPTSAYISTYQEAYTNPNLTTWKDYGQPWPKNKLGATGCK